MSAVGRAIELSKMAGIANAGKVAAGLVRMHWRYFAVGRGRGLAKMLPMTVPMKVHVDPASGCNFRCFFCPQTDPKKLKARGFQAKSMPLDMFYKLVDDLRQLDGRVDELVLGNYGEPLLNKHVAAMVKRAKSAGVAREVSLITNASLMDRACSDALVAAGLDKIRISVEALSDEGYRDTALVEQSFDAIVANVRGLREAIRAASARTFVYVKIIDTGLDDALRRKFFDVFTPLADSVAIENLMPMTAKAKAVVGENEAGMTGVSFAGDRKVCPSPFYSLSIHSNGDVGVCCADWVHKTVVGSISDQTLGDIWHGERLRQFRLEQLNAGYRKMSACAGCQIVKSYPHYEDLDDVAPALAERYAAPASPVPVLAARLQGGAPAASPTL